MLTKEEAKEQNIQFWNGFKHYCSRKQIHRRWVLTGVKIKGVRLKFHADTEKALVLFQIDHRDTLHRYKIYECMMSYQDLMAQSCGADLRWEEDYCGLGNRTVSAIYFELPGVSINRPEEWERIYAFFADKMVLLEEAYWEYRDLINERMKQE